MRLHFKSSFHFFSIFFFLLFLSSCDKFEWYNPYDTECPKALFTPSSPGVTMEGNSVKLTWSQENNNISGFNLLRSAEGEQITILTQTQKNNTQYLDANITPGKKYTYYVLAVAGTNKSDTIKAEITPVFPITISTGSVTDLTETTAKVSGNITNAGGGTVISRGICWSTSTSPTINSSKTTEGTGAGQYISTISGLNAGTRYYARAYGENSRGVVYGNEVSFTTVGLPLTGIPRDVDGNVYTEVKIGDQIWMGENLRVTKYRNGEPIEFVSNVPTTSWAAKANTPAYCIQQNNPANSSIYGNMYNWAAVIDARGLAPEGWRVPTNEDWQKLLNFLGTDAVNKLTSPGTLEMGTGLWRFPNQGNNQSGLNFHPSGYIFDQFADVGTSAFIWTSTGNVANKSAIAMVIAGGGGGLGGWSTQYGLVVRCIKN